MPALYRRFDLAYQTAWTNLSQQAAEQDQVLLAAPGTLFERESSGNHYLVHQFRGVDGKQRQMSIGRADDPTTQAAGQALSAQIDITKGLIEQVRNLAKLGYQVADPKTYSVVAALHNAGLFHRGLTLVGSHAYGVLLNTLGISAGLYQSFDVDVARGANLGMAEPGLGLAELLAQTNLTFMEVPPFHHGAPSTSFKEPGKSQFRIDLLVPSRTDEISTMPVPELQAYATTLPYLGYLLEETFMSTLASRHGVVAVRVPDPARFAVHKLVVSGLRVNERDKIQKDVHQAAVLMAMLTRYQPGDVEAAVTALQSAYPDAMAPARRRLPMLAEALGESADTVRSELALFTG